MTSEIQVPFQFSNNFFYFEVVPVTWKENQLSQKGHLRYLWTSKQQHRQHDTYRLLDSRPV